MDRDRMLYRDFDRPFHQPINSYEQEELQRQIVVSLDSIVKEITKNILSGETELADSQSASMGALLKALGQDHQKELAREREMGRDPGF